MSDGDAKPHSVRVRRIPGGSGRIVEAVFRVPGDRPRVVLLHSGWRRRRSGPRPLGFLHAGDSRVVDEGAVALELEGKRVAHIDQETNLLDLFTEGGQRRTFRRFNREQQTIRIGSLGADGIPGGDGEDEDIGS